MSIGACRVISNPAACQKPLSCTYLWSASPYFPVGCPPWLYVVTGIAVRYLSPDVSCSWPVLSKNSCPHLGHILFRRSPLIVNLLRKDCRNSCLILSSRCIGPCWTLPRETFIGRNNLGRTGIIVSRLSRNSKCRALLSSSGDKGTETFLINATL